MGIEWDTASKWQWSAAISPYFGRRPDIAILTGWWNHLKILNPPLDLPQIGENPRTGQIQLIYIYIYMYPCSPIMLCFPIYNHILEFLYHIYIFYKYIYIYMLSIYIYTYYQYIYIYINIYIYIINIYIYIYTYIYTYIINTYIYIYTYIINISIYII